jgi:alpha-tubulin N-acetyltransferase 1
MEKQRAEASTAAVAAFEDDVTILDASSLKTERWCRLAGLGDCINELGRRSAKAQGLRTPVTIFHQLTSGDQRLYVYANLDEQPRALGGLLKVGRKQLYHWDHDGNHRCLANQLSVLDFYVCEEWQRRGIGHRLFEHMISCEQTTPERVAYDRPSPKLLAFLRKHFGLQQFVPQRNNFVIYDAFFQTDPRDVLAQGRPLTSRGCS